MAQDRQDHEFRTWQFAGNEMVETWIAAAIILARQHQDRAADLMQPWRHLRLGIDIEDIEEDSGISVDHLLHATGDDIGPRLREFRCEPAVFQRFETGAMPFCRIAATTPLTLALSSSVRPPPCSKQPKRHHRSGYFRA